MLRIAGNDNRKQNEIIFVVDGQYCCCFFFHPLFRSPSLRRFRMRVSSIEERKISLLSGYGRGKEWGQIWLSGIHVDI